MLLAGDALSLINPLTGEGIYYAVLSGALAGRAAVSPATPAAAIGRRSDASWAAISATLRLRCPVGPQPWHRRAGVTAAERRPEVFDDFVELGLGRGLLTPRLLAGLGAAAIHRRVSAAGV